MKNKVLTFVVFAILAVLAVLAVSTVHADPPPTNPVHRKECRVHNGRPTWYVEPALSAHINHGDPPCRFDQEPPHPDDPTSTPAGPNAPTSTPVLVISNEAFFPDIHTDCIDRHIVGLGMICEPNH